MRCEDIRELMSEHIDRVLDTAGEQRLSEHLAGCAECRQDLEVLRQTVSLAGELDTLEPPADLLDKIHSRIERDRWRKPGVVWSFLSMTQVRVAIAACFVAVLCVYSVRELTQDMDVARHPEFVDEAGMTAESGRTTARAVAPEPALDDAEVSEVTDVRDVARQQIDAVAMEKADAGSVAMPLASVPRRGGGAEADGGIWREAGRLKEQRQTAAEPPPPVSRPVVPADEDFKDTKGADVALGAAVETKKLRNDAAAAPAPAKKMEMLGRLSSAGAVVPRQMAEEQERSADAAPVNMTVVTARRADVLTAVRELSVAAPMKPAESEAAVDVLAARRDAESTVVDIRLTVTAYANLVNRLRELGEVSLGAEAGEVKAADGDGRRSMAPGAKRGSDADYVTVRVTIVVKP